MRFDNEALHAARRAQLLSKRELATKADLSLSTIKRLERGTDENPRLGTCIRLARTLDVEASALIHE